MTQRQIDTVKPAPVAIVREIEQVYKLCKNTITLNYLEEVTQRTEMLFASTDMNVKFFFLRRLNYDPGVDIL